MTRKDPKIVLVPYDLIDSVWFKAIPHLMRGEKQWCRYFTLEQMRELLKAGKQQLWLIIDGPDVLYTIISQIEDYPNVRSFRVCYLGGEGLNTWYMPMMRTLEVWAREHGCKQMEFSGRDEWERLLAKLFGYVVDGKVYRKEL